MNVVLVCVWPYDAEACDGVAEVRGLCHRHYMRAVRHGILREFPASSFFRDSQVEEMVRPTAPTLCGCEIPRRGDADQCDRCGRLIMSGERAAYLRANYRIGEHGRRVRVA